MTYTVSFAQWDTYEVEAENVEEAIDKAYKDFHTEKTRPIARTDYDEVIIENEDGEQLAHY
jgi:hypothetical protein